MKILSVVFVVLLYGLIQASTVTGKYTAIELLYINKYVMSSIFASFGTSSYALFTAAMDHLHNLNVESTLMTETSWGRSHIQIGHKVAVYGRQDDSNGTLLPLKDVYCFCFGAKFYQIVSERLLSL